MDKQQQVAYLVNLARLCVKFGTEEFPYMGNLENVLLAIQAGTEIKLDPMLVEMGHKYEVMEAAEDKNTAMAHGLMPVQDIVGGSIQDLGVPNPKKHMRFQNDGTDFALQALLGHAGQNQ